MAFARPFAYNPGSQIPGTEQIGNLSIGAPTSGFTNNPQYWNGPDEELGYVIAQSVSGNTQPTPISGVTASVGFFRTEDFTDESFINLSEIIAQQSFATAADAKTWLNNNGYWTSYVVSLCDSFTFVGNNANTTTTSAINTGGGGWDSSAYSTETYTNPVTLTFQTTDNGNYLMGGFSYNPTSNPTTYLNTTYGLYVQPGFLEIYENGSQVNVPGAMTTLSTDVWKVEYNGTDVRYYKNDVLIYISSNPVTQPLHVFFALLTPAEGVDNVCFTEQPAVTPTPTSTPANTPTPTETSSPTPTPTVTPTSTDLTNITTYTISGCTSLNEFVADLGPGALAPGDVFYFDFTGGTPSGCYRIVNKINTTPTDGTTPLYFYSSCALCVEAREVTPTPTVTQTPTTTPTPTSTQTPVTGYSFNLVTLPYNFPSSGNTIMVDQSTPGIGTTNPNLMTIQGNGIYFNAIDSNGIDRASYFSSFLGQSITITMSQAGSTAIYSGSSSAFQSWTNSGQTGFNFNYGVAQSGFTSGTTVLIQSATTNWVTGQTVTISAVVNGAGVTPTPTATSVTPTPTPTSGATGDGWFFYYTNGGPVASPPSNNGNTAFIPGAGLGTYNPNYTGGTLNMYFNNNNSAGTSYSSQFSTLDTAGGTMTINQGSSTVIYSGTAADYQSSGTFLYFTVSRSAQMIQSASTPFVSGTSINVVVS